MFRFKKKKIIDSIFGIVGSSGTKFLPLLFKILQTFLRWKRGNIWKSLPKIFRAERIWSRKDELTAKCPMINSWCKTVFVPRIFRLSLSALGCKLRVRNWVNYAGETNGPTRKRNPVFSSSNIYVARYFSVRG